MHKTKFFKKIFESNVDDHIIAFENNKIPVMTQETFVPLMGQMWDKAKTRYKKRYKQKALEFAEWLMDSTQNQTVVLRQQNPTLWGVRDGHIQQVTTSELYEIWKKEN